MKHKKSGLRRESAFCALLSESGVGHEVFVEGRFGGMGVAAHPEPCDAQGEDAQKIERQETQIKSEESEEMAL